eukprot:scaffold106378_cov34-Prasinocladus_malaysianus.AAC.1
MGAPESSAHSPTRVPAAHPRQQQGQIPSRPQDLSRHYRGLKPSIPPSGQKIHVGTAAVELHGSV